MGGFLTTIGGIVCPIAVSFLAEGIHIIYQKIKDRDKRVAKANKNIYNSKRQWEQNLKNATEMEPTPGELQEHRMKESIVAKIRKYRKPRKISSGKGYSLKMDYGFEKKAIKRLVDHYVLKMEENNKVPDTRVTQGYLNYVQAVQKAEDQDRIRDEFIEKAETHMLNFVAHVKKYIGKYINLLGWSGLGVKDHTWHDGGGGFDNSQDLNWSKL